MAAHASAGQRSPLSTAAESPNGSLLLAEIFLYCLANTRTVLFGPFVFLQTVALNLSGALTDWLQIVAALAFVEVKTAAPVAAVMI